MAQYMSISSPEAALRPPVPNFSLSDLKPQRGALILLTIAKKPDYPLKDPNPRWVQHRLNAIHDDHLLGPFCWRPLLANSRAISATMIETACTSNRVIMRRISSSFGRLARLTVSASRQLGEVPVRGFQSQKIEKWLCRRTTSRVLQIALHQSYAPSKPAEGCWRSDCGCRHAPAQR